MKAHRLWSLLLLVPAGENRDGPTDEQRVATEGTAPLAGAVDRWRLGRIAGISPCRRQVGHAVHSGPVGASASEIGLQQPSQ